MKHNTGHVASNASPPDTSLKRGVLGTWAVVFLVVSAAAPLNLIAGYGPLGYLVGGIGAPAGFLIAGAVLGLFVVGLMAMTRYVDRPGTFYAYIGAGLGRRMAQGAAAVALFAYLAIQVGAAGILSVTTQTLLDDFFGIQVKWWVIAYVFVLLMWYLGRRGIDVGARVLFVLLTAEVGILAIITVAVLVQGGPDGFSAASFEPTHVFNGGMAAASIVWIGAFIGIEYTAVYRTETKNPERTIPRAALISLLFLALFYCLVSWAVIQAFGDANLVAVAGDHHTDMVFIVADQYVGGWARDLTVFLQVTSTLASGLAYFNTISRYGHSMAHDKMLPARLGKVHPVHGSPVAGNLQAIVTAAGVSFFAIGGLDPYANMTVWLSTPGVLALILLMTLTSVAVLVFFIKQQAASRPSALILWSSGIAAVLLGIVMYLIIDNIELMTGTTGIVNVVSAIAPFAVLVLAIAFIRSHSAPKDANLPVVGAKDLGTPSVGGPNN